MIGQMLMTQGQDLAPFIGIGLAIFILLFFLAILVIQFICWGKIGQKCGFNFWLTAILMLIPIANIFMFLFLGFSKRSPVVKAPAKETPATPETPTA